MTGRSNELSAENARLSSELSHLTQKMRRLQHEVRSLDPASARTRQDAVRIVQRLEARLSQATASRLYALPAWTSFMEAAMDGNEHLLRLRLARGFHTWHEEVEGSTRRRRARERTREAQRGAAQTCSESDGDGGRGGSGNGGGAADAGGGDDDGVGGGGDGGNVERRSEDDVAAGDLAAAAVAGALATTTTADDAPLVANPDDSPRLSPSGSVEPRSSGEAPSSGGAGGGHAEETLAERAMRLEEENERLRGALVETATSAVAAVAAVSRPASPGTTAVAATATAVTYPPAEAEELPMARQEASASPTP